MANCAKCGQCCTAIRITATKKQVRESSDSGNKAFVLEHWHRISRSTAEARLPGIVDGAAAYYECDMYNPETKLCTAHKDRPPICRGFPWYDGALSVTGAELRPFTRCSYWHDVPIVYWPKDIDPLPSPED